MRIPTFVIVAAALGQPLDPAALHAQIRGVVDAGSGTMHSGAESPFGIVRLAPALQIRTTPFTLDADADFAGHTEHGWQSYGHLRSAWRQTLAGQLEGSLGLEAGASRTRWGRSSGGWLGMGRIQLGNDTRGLALGLASGHTFASSGTQPLSRLEAGGWSRLGRINFGFWLKRTGITVPGSPVQSDGDPRDTLSTGGGPATQRRLLQDHYTDIEATLGWAHGNLALEAGAGRRIGKAFRYTSWHLQALYQVTNRVALVASSGQFPVDVVSGLPSGGFTTFSMRFNLRNDPPAPARASPALFRSTAAFTAAPVEDGTHLIVVRIPQASVVEIMGDFTDWTPVLLVPGDDNSWRLRMKIPAGLHEVNLRVDGGAWTVPAGLTRMDDGLGGAVGMFVVE